ncbi:hypothetical protein WJX84_002193 [Apatococcus fuscideae]|uniref:Uncharacterized protein n=1 Tax=Apatococcus fuscideae TaxID=2026836 RepID=A0AAW1SSR4_9CHLO
MAGIYEGLDSLPPQSFQVADAWELEACSVLMSTDRQSGACAPDLESVEGFGGALGCRKGSETEVAAADLLQDSLDHHFATWSTEDQAFSSDLSSSTLTIDGLDGWIDFPAAGRLEGTPSQYEHIPFSAAPFQPAVTAQSGLHSGLHHFHEEQATSKHNLDQPSEVGLPVSKRQRSTVNASHIDTPELSEAAACPHRPQMRRKHVSSVREMELKALLAGLEQPQGLDSASHQDPIGTIQSLNNVMKLPGSASRALPEQMRVHAVKGMMVHPGWNVLVPCEASVQQIYMAYEGGNADLLVNVTCGQGQQYASLRDLMAIPSHQHRAMLREPYMRVVNAQHLKRTQGDACHRTMLHNIGLVMLLSSVFFAPAAGLNFQGKTLVPGPSEARQPLPDPHKLKMALGLDASQTRMARNLWKEASAALSRLKEERLELLSRMGPLHPEALARQFSAGHTACQTAALMQQAKADAEKSSMIALASPAYSYESPVQPQTLAGRVPGA